MLKSLKKVMVGMLGATFLISALAPVSAAPTMLSAPAVANENLQQVRDHRWGGGDRHWGGHRPGYRPGWQGRPGYWNGHRGYRYYRHAIAATAMAGGIRWQLSEPVRSLAALLLPRHRRRLPFIRRQPIVTATPIFSGAITAISPTGLRTTRSSLIMAPASSAIRPTD
ncbi:BA14K family protein [Brucella ceti TE28753-12]|nr:BA14K family protein [Brucella ceti TE28753-12]